MKTINPKEVSTGTMHAHLLGVITPRPIALASTIDKDGNVNLSPFSFFNVFSANPPILIFSPARRVRDNTVKHSLENVLETKEVVVNIVNHSIVEQVSLASTEYEQGVNEFVKSGLTEASSNLVAPPRVKESPASFECKVKDVIALGDQGGAGNLVICEVVLAHFSEEIFDENGVIDPHRVDTVGRMGGDWYCRAKGNAIFELPKPIRNKGIGVDQIPESIRLSDVLTGNNLGRLGNVEFLPSEEEIKAAAANEDVKKILKRYKGDEESRKYHLHLLAKKYLEEGDTKQAWKILLNS
ncbi:flavin reductase family protein [Xanthovirga aplysinae]|uniref:flavin reductase family protein n=1 Tax=Xanthovirga aplysinae TaxID=2529853 RepID=UPI0012BD4E88|nr:flavin reductase family protein [Xanthovirga aplysinae]MTI30370.1 flavin reductase family protein [Xanthovirga aplysinae]